MIIWSVRRVSYEPFLGDLTLTCVETATFSTVLRSSLESFSENIPSYPPERTLSQCKTSDRWDLWCLSLYLATKTKETHYRIIWHASLGIACNAPINRGQDVMRPSAATRQTSSCCSRVEDTSSQVWMFFTISEEEQHDCNLQQHVSPGSREEGRVCESVESIEWVVPAQYIGIFIALRGAGTAGYKL